MDGATLNPYAPPSTSSAPVPSAINLVARWQKNVQFLFMLRCFVTVCLAAIIRPYHPSALSIMDAVVPLVTALVGGAVSAVFAYRLAASVQAKPPLAYAVVALFPLLWLLVLARLSRLATRHLREQGVVVSWFGATAGTPREQGYLPETTQRSALALALGWFMVVWSLFGIVPKFEQIFRELGITLPLMTEWTLFLARNGIVPVVLLLLWPVGHLLILQQAPDGAFRRGWSRVTWMGVILIAACGVIAMFLPLVKIIDELGKGSG